MIRSWWNLLLDLVLIPARLVMLAVFLVAAGVLGWLMGLRGK